MRRLALADWLNDEFLKIYEKPPGVPLTTDPPRLNDDLTIGAVSAVEQAARFMLIVLKIISIIIIIIGRSEKTWCDDNPPLQIENWDAPEIILAQIFWHIFLSVHLECGLFVWVSNTRSIHFGWSSSSWRVWRSWNQNDNMKEPTNTNHCVFLECAFLELLYRVRIAFVAFVRILNYKQLQGSCL